MGDTTTTFLSDSYIRCQRCYVELVNTLLEAQQSAPISDEMRDEIQDHLIDFAFYLNSILDNSTPEYWSDEEYAWIEGVRVEMKEAH